ncbi:MAG: hypothetical protein JSW53_01395 [Candidatus Bathyarchaeota archaeon]|nr:MAG: hypothetical protein JSW53_01395 [Candidatus Bathyarchaeota archaeon]
MKLRVTRNLKAVSTLVLILSHVALLICGALLSYMWVVGYYENLKIRIPENSDVIITNATFPLEDTSVFNVTIFNPSYSPTEARIETIATSTEDGLIHSINATNPMLPYRLPKAAIDFSGLQTFECRWDWANYTGEEVGIIAFLTDGSGPTLKTETPLVDLRIVDVSFNSALSVRHFNVTVQNHISSATHNATIDITEVSVAVEGGIKPNITEISPSLPLPLDPGESRNLMCSWDWTGYQNASVTVTVYTSQGYKDYITEMTPLPVTLEITEILFDVTNATHVDVAVRNDQASPTYVNVSAITVIMENLTVRKWTVDNGTAVNPPIPFALNRSSSETFICPWNWTEHRSEDVTIIVSTLQGFTTNYTQDTPPPIVLDITNLTFDPIDTGQFNLTVRNSEFSLADTEVTHVFVMIEDEIVGDLTDLLGLPISLNRTHSIDFACPWNWERQVGEDATIVVETEQGYSFHSDSVALVALTITGATFNPIAEDYFNITVQNPTLLNFTLATVTVTVDGTPSDLTANVTPAFPFLLPTDTGHTFICLWENWIDEQGHEITITIETQDGYEASYTREIPGL